MAWGASAAKAFIQRGAQVAVSGRDPAKLESATSWLGTRGVALGADATMEDQVRDLFRKVVKTLVASMGFTTSPGVVVVDGAMGLCTPSPMRDGKRRFDGIWIRSSYPTVPLFINSLSKKLEGRS